MASNSILAKLTVQIAANTAQFGAALQKTQSQLTSFTSGIQKMAGQVGIAFGAFQAFSVVKSAVNSIMEFEKELSTVKAITGATADEFQALKKSALDLGASTRYTSKQVASLQVEYGRLGFTTPEILAATKATLDLATATGEDLAKSADVAGSTVRAFGLNASEAQRVVDVMAESFNKSALGLENFSEAMKYVAPIARAADVSLEETTAMLGVLADAGIRGSMAGTSLRKIMSDIKGESGTLSERLQKLADKGLGMAGAMDEVGRTAYASLLVLTKNTDKTKDLTEELNNATGAGREAAKIMGDNLAGDITMLSSAYDGLIQSAGGSTSVLREFVQSLTQIVNGLNSGNGALGEFVSGWLKLATVVPRTLTNGIAGLTRLVSGTDEANVALKEQEEKTRIIGEHVTAAWKSGIQYLDVYIKALEGVPHEYEIIQAILAKFREEQQKINTEVLTPQIGIIQALEDQIKSFEEQKKAAFSTGAIENFNVKIQELKAELEALNASHPLSNFGQQQLSNAKSGKPTDVNNPVESATPSTPFGGPIAIDPIIMQKDAIIEAYMATDEAKRASADLSRELYKEEMAQRLEAAEAAMAYGNVIGESLAAAISGQQSGVQALKKITGDVIKLFLQQALAATVASAMKTGGPPPVAIAIAAAGAAAVGALFSKLVGGAGGGGGGGGSAVARTASRNSERSSSTTTGAQDSAPPTLTTVVKGQDLWVILENYNRNSKNLKLG